MAWSKAGSETLATSTVNGITITPSSASIFNQYMIHSMVDANQKPPTLKLSGTSTSVAYRKSDNGASDPTPSTGEPDVRLGDGTSDMQGFNVGYVCNIAGQEKLGINHYANAMSTDAGTAPARSERVFKDATTAQFTSLRFRMHTGASNVVAGSNFTVLGDNGVAVLPNNVQDNSIFVEKDTGERYWFDELQPNVVTINHRLTSTDDHAYADLGSTLSNTSWTMRYKMVISGLGTGSSNPNNSYLFALSKTNTAEQSGQALGLKIQIGGVSTDFVTVSGGTSSQNAGEGYNAANFSTAVANATWYVESIRNGSSFSVRITTSSDYTGGELQTWSTSGTVEDLRYIKYTNRDDNSSSWVLVSTISDINIYDGVTSATGTFVRDGTWTASASNKVTVVGTPATWTNPKANVGQIAQLSGSSASNTYTAASEFYTISTDTWDSAFNISGGGRARAGSAGSTEHAYLMGGQDGSSYYSTIDKVAWADETNTTISRSTRAWGGAVANAVSVCVGQSYYSGSYQTGINEYTYGTMAETSQGNTSSSHAFGGSFGNSTYGFVINGQNTGIERYTYSDKSKTASGFTASPTSTNPAGGHTGNSTTGISVNNTAGSGNARYDAYNISADTWTTNSATSTTPYEHGKATGSTKYDLFSTQTNTGTARQCEKYNYSSGALSSFTSVATNLDGSDQDSGASSTNTGVNS